jgi:hypothetical protein
MRKESLLAGLLVAFAILACSLPGNGSTAEPPTLTPGSSSGTDSPVTPPTVTPTGFPSLLPHALFYEAKDGAGHSQIHRLAPDGITTTQLTSEPVDVGPFDVSPVDGRIAYIANNQLILLNADGSGRTILVDGGPLDTDISHLTSSVGMPRFSPDGSRLAYGLNGLNLYDFSSGTTTNVLTNQVDSSGGFPVLNEGYSPKEFSPDGSKLLVEVSFYEAGTLGIYDLPSGAFYKFSRPDGGIICCSSLWSSDSSAVYVANPNIGMVDSGLWRFNASDGTGSTLLPSQNADATYNFADAPLLAPDGQLYFFFSNLPAIPSGHTPITMVRSAPDGVTGRAVIYPDTFTTMNEALWAPDAGKVIVVQGTTPDMFVGGAATLYNPGGGAPVPLVPDAGNLRWGP